MNPIEEIKARLDIAEVIGQHVQLQRAGRNYRALCPFHAERTPSFFVSPERQSWHCFGACGSGGDVITFIMKREGLEFGQALRLLAERAGVTLPEGRSEAVEEQWERLRQANEAAAQYYQHQLLNSEAGAAACRYLEGRGIDVGTAQDFSLGYAPVGWQNLAQYLSQRDFSQEELLAAGLLVQGEAGTYDRFRGRLLFPIRDVKGRVSGFGGRALDDSLPKYLNTPQTAIFDKGSILYALERARDGIRREGRAVLVEGYMDVIAAHQHGFTNVVASMGTALTEGQVRLLRRYTRNLVLALDADAAGSEAALRSQGVTARLGEESMVPVLTWRGLVRYQEAIAVDLRVAELPAGRDPDDLIRGDPEEWRRLVGEARPVLDYKFEAIAARIDLRDPKARSQAAQELLPLLSAIIDPVMRAHYLQRLSRLALVKEEELAAMVARVRVVGKGAAVTVQPRVSGRAKGDAAEDFLLALLLRYPSLRERGLLLDEGLLWQSENREVLAAWRRFPEVGAVRQALPAEMQPHLDSLLQKRLPPWSEGQAQGAWADCLRRLERRRLILEKQATAGALALQEEALGPASLVEAAANLWRGEEDLVGSDERLLEAAGLHLEDLEMGLRLHSGGRTSPEEG
jgi:DNA primase